MSNQLEDLVTNVKKFLNDEQVLEKSPKTWKVLTIQEICSRWEKPTYTGTQIVSIIRTDPDIRYEFTESRSRFKAKKFCVAFNPENKLLDLDKKQQFELLPSEEKALVKKLSEYKTIEKLREFYILGIICEKCKIKSLNKEWIALNTGEFCRGFNINELEAYNYIEDLVRHKLLVKYPTSNTYKLTLTEEEYLSAQNEINSVLVQEAEKSETNKEFNSSSFIQLSELNDMRKYLNDILKKNEEINQLLVYQLKLYDMLKVKDNLITKQKMALSILEESNMALTNTVDELKAKNKELQAHTKIVNKFENGRTIHIENTLNSFKSDMITEIEEYFRLSNGRPTATQTKLLKSRLFDLIYRYIEEAKNYHPRSD